MIQNRGQPSMKSGHRAVCGGLHATLAAAEAALARLPPPNGQRAARRNRAAEQRRLLTVLPNGTDLTGIYADATGWTVKPWINGHTTYVGHYACVHEALKARDAAVASRGHTNQTNQRNEREINLR
jgi:hypothetical protein